MLENNYDYYIWIDDDIYISNLNITIESIINKYNFDNILISNDPTYGEIMLLILVYLFVKIIKKFYNILIKYMI